MPSKEAGVYILHYGARDILPAFHIFTVHKPVDPFIPTNMRRLIQSSQNFGLSLCMVWPDDPCSVRSSSISLARSH